jgi:BioD-like phosphotransacetylase family protein
MSAFLIERNHNCYDIRNIRIKGKEVKEMGEELDALVKRIAAKDLREAAKKRGIKTACVKKIDIAKQLPREVLDELSTKQ